MRLYYLAGDRTSALRQYQRCTAAIREELDVKPAQRTSALYEQMRADNFESVLAKPTPPELVPVVATTEALPDVLVHLNHLQSILSEIQKQVRRDIQAIKTALTGRS